MLNPDDLDFEVNCRFRELCNDVFFKKSGYTPLSDYARALACLMFYRYDNNNLGKIATHYLKSSENDYLLRKYMIFVSLTVKNADSRQKIQDKAKIEQNQSISRLVRLIQSIDKYKSLKETKDFLRKKQVYIYSKDGDSYKIIEDYSPIRSEILGELISIYSTES